MPAVAPGHHVRFTVAELFFFVSKWRPAQDNNKKLIFIKIYQVFIKTSCLCGRASVPTTELYSNVLAPLQWAVV